MGKKIGLLGGTFDPVHHGHLNLAFELMEKKGLDEVWFIPAQINPHKQEIPPKTTSQQRLEMLKLAIQDIPSFKAVDIEHQLPTPSYTINTLQLLFEQNSLKKDPDTYYLLLGEDSIPGFIHWSRPEEIVKMVPLLIGSRYGDWHLQRNQELIFDAIQRGLTKTRLFDLSSTEVRERFKQGLYCGHLIPTLVLEYINQHHLYR